MSEVSVSSKMPVGRPLNLTSSIALNWFPVLNTNTQSQVSLPTFWTYVTVEQGLSLNSYPGMLSTFLLLMLRLGYRSKNRLEVKIR